MSMPSMTRTARRANLPHLHHSATEQDRGPFWHTIRMKVSIRAGQPAKAWSDDASSKPDGVPRSSSLRSRKAQFSASAAGSEHLIPCSVHPDCQNGNQSPRLLGHRQGHQRSASGIFPLRTHTLPPSDAPQALTVAFWHADLLYGSKSGVFQYNQALNITTRTADGVVRSHDPAQPANVDEPLGRLSRAEIL